MGGWVKDHSRFTRHDAGLELPFENHVGYFTPNADFFVCSAGATPVIDTETWSLHIGGDAVQHPLDLSYDALTAMPQHTVAAYLECAGNHRALFETVLGVALDKRMHMVETKWGLGAVGMAEWSGVRLADVLQKAGLKDSAYHVCPVGHDRGIEGDDGVKVPLPVEKALDPDTLIAFHMNGEPLPPDHGFPARLIVPGWVGTYSIKWLDRIDVSASHLWVHRNTELYVMIGDDWQPPAGSPARGTPVTEQSIKSALALPWPAALDAGLHRLHGYARSPDAEIAAVAWSANGGATWTDADLVGPNRRWSWTRFEFDWTAAPGAHTIMTRAADTAGRIQPDTITFNHGGYLFNQVHPHPVQVT